MNKKPILSICIPTYNRGKYLIQALDSYVNNKAFSDEIEIVISDNASTDNTRELVAPYLQRFSNIKYFCNERNLIDGNFPITLDRATGHYLKLMNDNLIITEDGLGYMLDKVKENLKDKTPLLFTNDIITNGDKKDCIECDGISGVVYSISFVVTAILIFGCWAEDWKNVSDRLKYVKLKLCQDDWVYQIVEKRGKMRLYTGAFCYYITMESKQRTGYNWFEVHVDNYYAILQPYIDKGLVSKKALKADRISYLKNLHVQIVMSYLYNIMPEWQFDMSGATKVLWRNFKCEPLYYLMMLTFPVWGISEVVLYFIKRFIYKCRL